MARDDFHFPAPTPSDLGDHEVPRDGDALDGVRVALVVTGGIAAFQAPMVARALRRQGAVVTAFATTEGLRYVAREALDHEEVEREQEDDRDDEAAEHGPVVERREDGVFTQGSGPRDGHAV